MQRSAHKGFSLIEILVVIAIITILSSTIVASLAMARQKARDAVRIAEIGQMRRALEVYFDANQTFPSTTPECSPACERPEDDDAAIQLLHQKGFLQKTPVPIPGGANARYVYRGIYHNAGTPTACDNNAPQGTVCTDYALGISLERSDNPVLTSDADQGIGDFFGTMPDCTSGTAGEERCFDVN